LAFIARLGYDIPKRQQITAYVQYRFRSANSFRCYFSCFARTSIIFVLILVLVNIGNTVELRSRTKAGSLLDQTDPACWVRVRVRV